MPFGFSCRSRDVRPMKGPRPSALLMSLLNPKPTKKKKK